MSGTRINDNRTRANRINRWKKHGYFSSLDVLNTLIECGADRDAVNQSIIDAMNDGAGNKVAFRGVTFQYEGNGYWLRPIL
jgi:hypothetical protein